MDDQFIKAWMEGKITPDELERQRRLQGNELIDQLEDILRSSSRLKVPENQTKEEAWKKIINRIDESNQPKTRIIKWNLLIPISIAASLAIFLIAYFFIFSATSVSTPSAQMLVYMLPDGSKVTMNADSKITFRKFGWQEDRAVTIEGEAFFEVKKGSRFTVTTKLGTIIVLGTSFNVYVRNKSMKVACFSGSVKTNVGNNEVILIKGEFTEVKNEILTRPQKFVNGQEATWRSGEFYFDSVSLRQVIEELQRQFNISIEYHGDDTRVYSGYFNKKSLDVALEMVFKPMSLHYHRVGTSKVIVE